MGMFTQSNLIIPLTSGEISCSGNTELDSFHMKGYNHATICLLFNTALSASAPVLTIESASSDSGDSLCDATFHYRLAEANAGGASADKLGDFTTASAYTLTPATILNKMLVLEVDAGELPTASKQYQWLTVDIGANASVGSLVGWAILSEPRYADNQMNTALA